MGVIENRKAFRLPFRSKVIMATAERVVAGNSVNLSANGVFFNCLDTAFQRDTTCQCLFLIRDDQPPVSIAGEIKRIVVATEKTDEFPGIAVSFSPQQQQTVDRLNEFMNDSRHKFELVLTLLQAGEPDLASLEPLISELHLPPYADLGELRFAVEHIVKMLEFGSR